MHYLTHASPASQSNTNDEDFGETIDDSNLIAPSSASIPSQCIVLPDPPCPSTPMMTQPKPEVNLFDDSQTPRTQNEVIEDISKVVSKKKRATDSEGEPSKKKKRKSLNHQHRSDIDNIFKGI